MAFSLTVFCLCLALYICPSLLFLLLLFSLSLPALIYLSLPLCPCPTPLLPVSLPLYFSFLCQPHSCFHHLTLSFFSICPLFSAWLSHLVPTLTFIEGKDTKVFRVLSLPYCPWLLSDVREWTFEPLLMTEIVCLHSTGSCQAAR